MTFNHRSILRPRTAHREFTRLERVSVRWLVVGCMSLLTACATSTAKTNAALGRDFVEKLQNASSPTAYQRELLRIISPDYIQHNALVPPGRDGLAKFSTALAQSFPDAHATLRDAFATDSRVVARWTFTGTLTGAPFLGIGANGQKVEFDIQDEWSVKNGQLYEHWDRLDWARALVQLGVTGLPAAFVQLAAQPVSRGTPVESGNEVTPATSTANASLGRSFVTDIENASSAEGFMSALTRVVSPDYIQHNLLVPPGRKGLADFAQVLKASFPDAKAALRETIANDDRVVARWNFTGTLSGQPLLGIVASGQKVDFDIFDIWTLKDGQLYEHWDEIDWTRALVQLGVTGLPAPFMAEAAQPVNQ